MESRWKITFSSVIGQGVSEEMSFELNGNRIQSCRNKSKDSSRQM